MAAALGVALSFAGLRLVLAGLPWVMSVQALRPIAIDRRALVFACITSILIGVGTALAPLARVRRASMQASLKGTAIGATSHVRLRSTLVVLQLAVTTVLLIAGALLANGFVRIRRIDTGFAPANLLTVSVSLPSSVLPTTADRAAFLDEWRRRAETVPGVAAVTVTGGSIPPHLGFGVAAIETADRGVVTSENTYTANDDVDGRFFATLGIPLLAGRTFDERDRANTAPVAVISQALAARLWPGGWR